MKSGVLPNPETGPRGESWPLLGIALLGLYAVATMAPTGALWGLHALGFLPWWLRVGGLAACAALLWPPAQSAVTGSAGLALAPFIAGPRRVLGLAALFIALFVTFYAFAIRTDIYGDSTTILRAYADNSALPTSWLPRLFNLDVLAHREALTLMLHQAVAHFLGISIGQAFRGMSSLSGAAYVLLWLLFVVRTVPASPWRIQLILVGCLVGGNQVFFGHIESYPFASLVSLTLLLSGWTAVRNPRRYWMFPLLLLLCVAAHPASLYFVPAFLMLSAHNLSRRFPIILSWMTWRRLVWVLIVPSLLIGLALYLFHFRSFAEPHAGLGREFQHSFLPMVAAPPPLDKYTLQSVNHWRDVANVLVLVGMPAILALGGFLVLNFKAIAWKEPELKFAVLGLIYPLAFFLAVNPGLSMPRDWDMFALLGPPLLLLLVAVFLYSRENTSKHQALGTSLAFGVFSVAFWVLNASPRPLSARLETVGEYVFTTYYTSSSYILNKAHAMEPELALQTKRRERVIRRLAKHVVEEDVEYTNLLTTLARMYRDQGDLSRGAYWCEQAVRVSPNDANAALWLINTYLLDGRVKDARPHLDRLVAASPKDPDVLTLSAVAASQEGNLEGALDYLEAAKRARPADPKIDAWLSDVRHALASRPPESKSARAAPPKPLPPSNLADSSRP